jgi:hypothetical protein
MFQSLPRCETGHSNAESESFCPQMVYPGGGSLLTCWGVGYEMSAGPTQTESG